MTDWGKHLDLEQLIELRELRAEVERLREVLRRANEALTFYARESTWADHEDSIYEQPEPWAVARGALCRVRVVEVPLPEEPHDP